MIQFGRLTTIRWRLRFVVFSWLFKREKSLDIPGTRILKRPQICAPTEIVPTLDVLGHTACRRRFANFDNSFGPHAILPFRINDLHATWSGARDASPKVAKLKSRRSLSDTLLASAKEKE